jgi:O-methyltransferase domain
LAPLEIIVSIKDLEKWSNLDYKSFVDIGTAQGMLAVTIARGHNHLSGAGYDLPEVKPIFEEFIAQHGMQERVKFLSGNFLTDSLPTADVLIMGHILHDWDLSQKRMLLEKGLCRAPQGRSAHCIRGDYR